MFHWLYTAEDSSHLSHTFAIKSKVVVVLAPWIFTDKPRIIRR